MHPAPLPLDDVRPAPTESVFGVGFWASGSDEAEAAVRAWLREGRYFTLAFANPEFLLTAADDPALTAYLGQCRAVFADGAGILWASRAQRGRITERITGTDFQWRIFRLAAEAGLSVFVYGGKPGVAEEAVANIRVGVPTLARIGCCDGYLPEAVALERIAAFAPDIIMVCLGNPRQEAWITRHGPRTGARLLFGNGGAVDFAAGRVQRAPPWMCRHGLEWLWRLGQDLSWTRIRRQARLARYVAKLVRLRLAHR